MLETRFRAQRSDGWAAQVDLPQILEVTLARANKHGEEFRIRWPNEMDFGPPIDAEQLSKKLKWRLPRDSFVSAGDTVSIFCTKDGTRIRIRKEYLQRGLQIVRAARSQLGVRYSFGSADPSGPHDTSAAFDCSGLTMWSYAQAVITISRSAEAQRTDPSVRQFSDRAKIVPGDLVFYNTGRLPPGVADHVGVASSKSVVIDASSTLKEVVERNIDANPILIFGRVKAANGPLA
jgi:hypothetical protein